MSTKPPTMTSTMPTRVMKTRALSEAQVRRLLAEGHEVRRELERRIDDMHRVSPSDAAARAR